MFVCPCTNTGLLHLSVCKNENYFVIRSSFIVSSDEQEVIFFSANYLFSLNILHMTNVWPDI